jgi:hypothetical protein
MMTSIAGGSIRHEQPGRCWVITDPRLAEDGSLDALRDAVTHSDVRNPEWRRPSGRQSAALIASSAVEAEADRVVVVGDQTMIRSVAAALANTGVPLGLVPVGSGCGLARSIGVPTDLHHAVAAALGESRSVADLMRVTIDGTRRTSSFLTVGIEDGEGAGPVDSRRSGFAASLRGVLIKRSSFIATATVDRHQPTYSRSAACVIGIGRRVVAAERPSADNPLLHLSMLRTSGRFGIRRMETGQAIRRGLTPDEGRTGKRILLVLDEVRPCYIDGALAGHAKTVSAELQPDALTLLIPA